MSIEVSALYGSSRLSLFVLCCCWVLVCATARADVLRWDTGEVIPGTEGVEPGPGVDLSVWNTDQQNLRYADFSGGTNLTDAKFYQSWLDHTDFGGAILFDANFGSAILTGANLAGANLAKGYLQYSDLTGADLSGTDLTDATLLRSRLASANLTGAVVKGVDFYDTTSGGFTKEQLYSTANYEAKDLRHIRFSNNDFTGWNLGGQDLSHSELAGTTLTDASLTGAVVTGATLGGTTARGFTKEQLDSTASYQEKNLQEIRLNVNDLSGWDLAGQDLTGAYLHSSDLTDASLAGADLTNVYFDGSSLTDTNFTGSIIAGTHWDQAISDGFTKEQLYSTASYQDKNLRRIDISRTSLEGWDLSGQDLTLAYLRDVWLAGSDLRSANLANAFLERARVRDADLRGANLKNAGLADAYGLESAILDSTTTYNQWTVFHRRFDPVEAGLTLERSPKGDFNGDDELDMTDIDLLVAYYNWEWQGPDRIWLLPMFDLDNDRYVNENDHRIWVKDLQRTWYGDANLDGEFDSGDMTQVFATGRYENGWFENLDVYVLVHNGAGWAEGDWNGDGVFDSSDMVTAFVDGGYEQGPRTDAMAVPEPATWLLVAIGVLPYWLARRTRRPV